MNTSKELLAEKSAQLRALENDYLSAKSADLTKLKVQAFDRIETICRGLASSDLIELTFGRVLEALRMVQEPESLVAKYERLKEDYTKLSDRLLESDPRHSS